MPNIMQRSASVRVVTTDPGLMKCVQQLIRYQEVERQAKIADVQDKN